MAPYFLLDQVHILYFNLLLHNLHFNVSLTLGFIALYHEPFAQVLTCEVGFWLFFFFPGATGLVGGPSMGQDVKIFCILQCPTSTESAPVYYHPLRNTFTSYSHFHFYLSLNLLFQALVQDIHLLIYSWLNLFDSFTKNWTGSPCIYLALLGTLTIPK